MAKASTDFHGKHMRRLFWDIETSPVLALLWRTGYRIDVSHDSIVRERAIITIAWKWENEKQVHALHWDKNQCDKTMLLKFIEVANEADELVAHYGDRFDLPWIKTRCLFHGINAFPIYKTIDTKAWASKYFYFNSNRLDYISKFLGFEGKIKTDYQLWLDIVLKKCPKALEKMIAYNKKDVIELQNATGCLASHSRRSNGGERKMDMPARRQRERQDLEKENNGNRLDKIPDAMPKMRRLLHNLRKGA
jgi:uncharacterized protein YprB with RNaseH-like and TPR domain